MHCDWLINCMQINATIMQSADNSVICLQIITVHISFCFRHVTEPRFLSHSEDEMNNKIIIILASTLIILQITKISRNNGLLLT